VDEPQDFKTLLSLGVDGILTNRPDRLKLVLNSGKAHLN
jgi:glycerophosphoryl diester phosphodiesterase